MKNKSFNSNIELETKNNSKCKHLENKKKELNLFRNSIKILYKNQISKLENFQNKIINLINNEFENIKESINKSYRNNFNTLDKMIDNLENIIFNKNNNLINPKVQHNFNKFNLNEIEILKFENIEESDKIIINQIIKRHLKKDNFEIEKNKKTNTSIKKKISQVFNKNNSSIKTIKINTPIKQNKFPKYDRIKKKLKF